LRQHRVELTRFRRHGSVGGGYECGVVLLVLRRTEIVEGRLPAAGIVPAFDVLKRSPSWILDLMACTDDVAEIHKTVRHDTPGAPDSERGPAGRNGRPNKGMQLTKPVNFGA
jgi:hypothetical protein